MHIGITCHRFKSFALYELFSIDSDIYPMQDTICQVSFTHSVPLVHGGNQIKIFPWNVTVWPWNIKFNFWSKTRVSYFMERNNWFFVLEDKVGKIETICVYWNTNLLHGEVTLHTWSDRQLFSSCSLMYVLVSCITFLIHYLPITQKMQPLVIQNKTWRK